MGQKTASGGKANKTPLFVTSVLNIRRLFRWLMVKTGGDDSAWMRGAKLVLVPGITDCFRTTVKVLRSIGPNEGVAFNN